MESQGKSRQGQNPMKYGLTFDFSEVHTIIAGLSELPAKHSYLLIEKISQLIKTQDEAREKHESSPPVMPPMTPPNPPSDEIKVNKKEE